MDLNIGKAEKTPASTYVTQTDVDWSLKHFIVLFILGALSGVFFSLRLAAYNEFPTSANVVLLAVAVMALSVVIVFQSLLLKSLHLFLWVSLAEAAGLLAFYYDGLSPWLVFSVLLFVGFLMAGFLRGRNDLTDHLTVHFGRFSKIVIASASGGLAIFLAVFYAGQFKTNGLSYNAMQVIAKSSEPIMVRFVPDFSADMNLLAFYQGFAENQFKTHPQVVMLSEEQKQQVYEQAALQLRVKIAEITSTPAQREDTVTQYFYRVSEHYLTALQEQGFSTALLALIVIIVYTLVRSVMFFLKWIVMVVGYVLFRLLQAFHIIYITTEPRAKEIIMVK